MDGVFLPIDRETLLRGASVRAHSESESWTSTGIGQVRGGLVLNPIKGIEGNEYNPTSALSAARIAETDNGEIKGWTFGGAVGIGARGSYTRVHARKHPNPLREGIHQHFKLSGTAEGLTHLAMKYLMEGGLKARKYFGKVENDSAIRAKLGLDKSDAANAERMQHNVHTASNKEEGFIEDSILLAKKTLLSEYTGEFEMFLGKKAPPSVKKAPPSVGEYNYESTTQYLRYISRDTQKVGGTIGAPLQFAGVPVKKIQAVVRSYPDAAALVAMEH